MSLYKTFNTVYEKLAYHVTYKLSKDGIITKVVKNDKFSLGRFNTISIVLLSLILMIFVIGLTSNELTQRNKEKLYLETFYVNQLCYEGNELSECYSISKYNGIKIYLDDRHGTKTLFVSGE